MWLSFSSRCLHRVVGKSQLRSRANGDDIHRWPSLIYYGNVVNGEVVVTRRPDVAPAFAIPMHHVEHGDSKAVRVNRQRKWERQPFKLAATSKFQVDDVVPSCHSECFDLRKHSCQFALETRATVLFQVPAVPWALQGKQTSAAIRRYQN